MEVTKENFSIVFPQFKTLLQSCDFYAIDLEMTGINLQEQSEYSDPLTQPEVDFATSSKICRRFSPIQIGVCLFHRTRDARGSAPSSPTVQAAVGEVSISPAIPPHLTKIVGGLPERLASVRNALAAATVITPALAEEAERLRADVCAALREGIKVAADEFEPAFDTFVSSLLGELTAVLGELKKKEAAAAAAKASPTTVSTPLRDAFGVIGGGYEARPFNFFVFPSEAGEVVMDRKTVSEFLGKHGMDFSKWIKQGIPYVTRERAAELRRAAALDFLAGGAGEGASPMFTRSLLDGIPAQDVQSIRSLADRLEEVARTKDPEAQVRRPYIANQTSFGIIDKIRQELGFEVVRKEGLKADVFWKLSAQAFAEGQADAEGGMGDASSNINVLEYLDKELGATLLFEAMMASKKPLVAHNCFKDLLFLHSAFHRHPAPSYAAFKGFVRDAFPRLVDTKVLCSLDELHDPQIVHNLEREYKFFSDAQGKRGGPQNAITFHHPLGFEAIHPLMLARPESKAAHDAAFDAWMSGALFLFIRKLLALQKIDVQAFAGIVPIYGLAYCCRMYHDLDCLPHDGPVLLVTAADGSRVDHGRLAGILSKYRLPGRIAPQGNNRLVFVSRAAQQNEHDFNTALQEVQSSVQRHMAAKVTLLFVEPHWKEVMKTARSTTRLA